MDKRHYHSWPAVEQTLRRLGLVVFNTLELKKLLGVKSVSSLYSMLRRYKGKGYIVQLLRGLYGLAGADISDLYVANRLYRPSYVSFETALSHHNIIPETVYSVSSATTKTTRRFRVEALGRLFTYHRIKRHAYTGYIPTRTSGGVILMADAEKALVDFLYLVTRGVKKPLGRIYINRLDERKMMLYAQMFNSQEVVRLVQKLFAGS